MPMLLDVSRAFAEVLINYLITEKLDALEVRCRAEKIMSPVGEQPTRSAAGAASRSARTAAMLLR